MTEAADNGGSTEATPRSTPREPEHLGRRRGRAVSLVWGATLTFAVWLPGVDPVAKYVGPLAVVAYLLVCAAAVAVVHRLAAPFLLERASRRLVTTLLVLVAVATIATFAVLHQRANVTEPGQGSDRDDAIDQAVDAILAGEYPYSELTYLDGPITSMPALLLISSPWVVAAGTSAVQNLVWVPLGMVLAAAWLGRRRALLACGLTAGLCFGFWQEHITGGDLVTSSIWVTAAVVWSYTVLRRPTVDVRAATVVGVVLGIALASRANYGILLIPVLAAVWYGGRRREAAAAGVAAVGAAALVTLPLYLINPSDFTPLTAAGKVTEVGDVLPGAGILIPLTGAVVAVWLAVRLAPRGDIGFLVACAVPQATMVVPIMVLLTIGDKPSASYSLYGFGFVWFLLLAGITALYGREPAGEQTAHARRSDQPLPAGTTPA